MNIPTFAAASESVIRCKEPIKSSIQFGSISNNIFENNVVMTRGTLAAKIPDIKGNSSVIIHCLGESCDASKSHIQFGSLTNFVGHHSKKDENIISTRMKKPVEIMPKPRTALFQGGEDDEHIAPQIIQLGSFIFDANKTIMMKEGVLANTATLETKLIFQGNNLHKGEKKQEIHWPLAGYFY